MVAKPKKAIIKMPTPSTIDQYIAAFPPDVQQRLQRMRAMIRKAAPDAVEVISYRMPAFKLHGNLVYFAGCKEHIGFYPTPSPIVAFRQELAGYKCSKGAVQFPLDKPLPAALIRKIVKFRVAEDLARAAGKRKR